MKGRADPPFAASDTTEVPEAATSRTMWDVFHSDRLEVERSLSTDAVRASLARGDLGPDDLIRPAGTTPWTRLADMPALSKPRPRAVGPGPEAPPAAPPPSLPEGPAFADDFEEFEVDDEEGDVQDEGPDEPADDLGPGSLEALPVADALGPESAEASRSMTTSGREPRGPPGR
ncbi:MAG: hypothetical protein WKF75_15340 [Singulisphaera sp.]